MAFKISDLDRIIKEGLYDDDDEFSISPEELEREREQFADVPEDAAPEELEEPVQAAEVDNAFELEPKDDGYDVSQNGYYVCNVRIVCDGKSVDISEVIDPSECSAIISDIAVHGFTQVYKEKLESMGYHVVVEK